MPRRRFWYLGLANILRDKMFSDPKWCALRATERDAYDNSLWGSLEAQRLHTKTGNILLEPETPQKTASWYDLGIDWGQPFQFKTWSSGYVMMRYSTLL